MSQSQPGTSEQERPGADVVSPDPSAGRGGTGGPPMRAEAAEERERKARQGGELVPLPQPLGTQRKGGSSPPLGRERSEQERSLHSPGPGEKSRGFEAANHWGLLATLK